MQPRLPLGAVKLTSSVIASGSVVSLAAAPVGEVPVIDFSADVVADDDGVDAGSWLPQPASTPERGRAPGGRLEASWRDDTAGVHLCWVRWILGHASLRVNLRRPSITDRCSRVS
jgi:hypothetical protein